MSATEALKEAAAAAAVEHVSSGMALGLGTGSTVAHLLRLIGERIEQGTLSDLIGVPSSVRTGREARQAGIPLSSLAETPHLDLTIDGADEISPALDLVKGMGGALLREKMIAQASDRVLIIADEGKAVERLGERSPIPLEVVEWGLAAHVRYLEARGATVVMRALDDGVPYTTDNGNRLLEVTFPDGIEDPWALDDELRARAGVVETGFFLGLATGAILAGPNGLRTLGSTP